MMSFAQSALSILLHEIDAREPREMLDQRTLIDFGEIPAVLLTTFYSAGRNLRPPGFWKRERPFYLDLFVSLSCFLLTS